MVADIILVAFLCLSIYLGYKKGFVKTISKLLCFVISIVAGKILHPHISGFVSETVVGEFISSKFTDETHLVTEGTNSIIKQAANGAMEGLADMAVSVVTALIIIIVVFIISNFVVRSIDLVAKLPVISALNKLLGLVAGFAVGVITIYLVFLVIAVVNIDASWIEGSTIAAGMFKENIIMNMIF